MICAGNAVNLMVFIAMGCLRTHSMRPYIWDEQTSMNFVCGCCSCIFIAVVVPVFYLLLMSFFVYGHTHQDL